VLGQFTQTVRIDGAEYLVRDVRVRDTSDRVSVVDFAIERDVVGDAAFYAVQLTSQVEIEQSVDESVLPDSLQTGDGSVTLHLNGEVVEIADDRIGGGADRRSVTVHTSATAATTVRLDRSWPASPSETGGCDLRAGSDDDSVALSVILTDLAAEMGVALEQNVPDIDVATISATRDSAADVLDEIQRRTGYRWEMRRGSGGLTLVVFDPTARVSPPIIQGRGDIVDGTLRVRSSGGDIRNIIRAAGYEYRRISVEGGTQEGSDDISFGEPEGCRVTTSGVLNNGLAISGNCRVSVEWWDGTTTSFTTGDDEGGQFAAFDNRQTFSEFELEGDGWEVVDKCVSLDRGGDAVTWGGMPPAFRRIWLGEDVDDQDDMAADGPPSVRVDLLNRRVEWRPTSVPPGASVRADILVRRKVWIERRDEASIAQFGPREGEPLDDPGDLTLQAAQERADAYLARKAWPKYDVELTTTRFGHQANTVCDVELHSPPLSRRMFVKSVTRTTDGTECEARLQLADQDSAVQPAGAAVAVAKWPDNGRVDPVAEIAQRLKTLERRDVAPAAPSGVAARRVGTVRQAPATEIDAAGWSSIVTAANARPAVREDVLVVPSPET
jgi:hypothetical protein